MPGPWAGLCFCLFSPFWASKGTSGVETASPMGGTRSIQGLSCLGVQGWMFRSKMFKNYVADQQLNLKDIIKTMEKISLDLRKMDELVNLLLCDLILNFSHPVKTEVVAKVEENNVVSEDFKISDQLELIPTLSNGI
ncbi:putative uncharacterized protein C5orf58 homolog isoform X2 [Petaurus breviceps papuanus]|uniref:putative uncharacterized protein C5orf58 homolog isoform X2 n=1 Tax=Petaurus breviceps papuanus TaxID=3040969 RepID=UPI0036D79F40